DMWETMYASHGVGLAAPQINKPIRVFVLDSAQVFESQEDEEKDEFPDAPGIKQVFINPHIIDLTGDEWSYEEGCLSIPKIREDVYRPESVTVEYLDENFKPHTKTFNGLTARILQHEYDHLEGKLFIDYLKPLKKTLIKRKLDDISKGKVKVDYKMTFPQK
ncbi:MAG TPA: peptide deformylase, partial [Parasegetibacter sp.]